MQNYSQNNTSYVKTVKTKPTNNRQQAQYTGKTWERGDKRKQYENNQK